MFLKFSDHVNNWEILRRNLPSEEGPAADIGDFILSSSNRKLSVLLKDNKFTIDQNISIMNRVMESSPSTITTILTAPNASTMPSRESQNDLAIARTREKNMSRLLRCKRVSDEIKGGNACWNFVASGLQIIQEM